MGHLAGAGYLDQRFIRKLLYEHTHTHGGQIALPGPQKCPVIGLESGNIVLCWKPLGLQYDDRWSRRCSYLQFAAVASQEFADRESRLLRVACGCSGVEKFLSRIQLISRRHQ